MADLTREQAQQVLRMKNGFNTHFPNRHKAERSVENNNQFTYIVNMRCKTVSDMKALQKAIEKYEGRYVVSGRKFTTI